MTVLGLASIFSVANAASPFFRDLKQGDRGLDVLALQRVLNSDVETQVAQTGLGSPGNETDYFGALTARAVIKFQEKYSSEVLVPAGLSKGTGFAGSFTRMRLSRLSVASEVLKSFEVKKVQTTEMAPPSSSDSNAKSFTSTPSPAAVTVYPSNYENLESYIAGVKVAANKKGYTAEKIAELETYIRNAAATTTNFREMFIKAVKVAEAKHEEKLAEEASGSNILTRLLSRFEQAVSNLVPEANAEMGMPFGGDLLFTFPCICTGGEVWSVELLPMPPTFAAILDYTIGTQMFSYYTAPFALNFLGEYIPGIPSCWQGVEPYCFLIPSWGLMTPMLGTSL